MKYMIRVKGNIEEGDTDQGMIDRADMSFWGISSADIFPPVGYRLVFDEKTKEPKFEPKRRCPACGRPEGVPE